MVVLHWFCWHRPDGFLEVDLFSLSAENLIHSGASQHEKLKSQFHGKGGIETRSLEMNSGSCG